MRWQMNKNLQLFCWWIFFVTYDSATHSNNADHQDGLRRKGGIIRIPNIILLDVASVANVVLTPWNEANRAKQIVANYYLYSYDFMYQIELRILCRFILT
jgi:hypothetical protein